MKKRSTWRTLAAGVLVTGVLAGSAGAYPAAAGAAAANGKSDVTSKVNYRTTIVYRMAYPDCASSDNWWTWLISVPGYGQQPVGEAPGSTVPVKPAPAAPKPAPAVPKPAPAAPAGTAQSQYAAQVVTLVNQERAKAGLPSLTSDAALTKVAAAKAQDMYDKHYFDHNSPTYGSPFDMMNSFGVRYSYAGENIAMGQRTPQEVMNAWMTSPGHKANILNSHYTKIGVAYVSGEWVQEFTG